MIVLDIDMDYFQNDIHTNDIDSDKYLLDSNIHVWSRPDFVNFLEKQCRLSKKRKIPGRVIKHHLEAFGYWDQLLKENKLYSPFKVIHVDAHSDLGYSMNVPFYQFLKSIEMKFMNTDLTYRIFESNENKKHINSGNYLLCAVIDNMISEIDYVYHDKLDVLDATKDVVECVCPNKLFRFNFCQEILKKDVHLNLIRREQFNITDTVDYITVAISPPFVRKEINELLDIMKDYIELDNLSL